MRKFTIIFLLAGAMMVTVAYAGKKKKEGKETAAAETSGTATVPNAKYDDIALFGRVINFIEKQYVEPVNTKNLVYGAIKGMLETLDPHSNFMPPEVYNQLKTDTAGKFGGLGIEVWVNKDGQLTIISPMEGTPAWKAGIKPGDKILEINGESTKGMTISDATSKIRGEIGTSIRFRIQRENAVKPLDFKLKRVAIDLKSVKHELLADGVGYIRLMHFQEHSSKEMKTALKSMEEKGKLKGLVLDLRNNPGGLLDEAVDIANLFIDSGVIVSTIGKTDKEVKSARSGIARLDFPIVVLVNGNSASAAEILAGALKDHKRALIAGSRTFGKGSVQTVIPLADDVGLKLTIARYYTPNGTSIQAKGIEPDLPLMDIDSEIYQKLKSRTLTLSEADLKNHFDNEDEEGELIPSHKSGASGPGDKADKKSVAKDEPPKLLDPKDDYQVQQALNYLHAMAFVPGAASSPVSASEETPKPAKAKM